MAEKRKVVRRIKASTNDATKPTKSAETNKVKQKIADDLAPAVEVKPDKEVEQVVNDNKVVESDKKQVRNKKPTKRNRKTNGKKTFILFVPFVAFGRYVRDSWRELRQVQWPSRSATWKMTLAIIVFCSLVGVLVVVFDWVSQWIIQEVVL